MAVECSLVDIDGSYSVQYFIIFELNGNFVDKINLLGLYLFLLNFIWWWQFIKCYLVLMFACWIF